MTKLDIINSLRQLALRQTAELNRTLSAIENLTYETPLPIKRGRGRPRKKQ